MIDDALFSQLTGNAGVAALISTRLYPEYAHQADAVYPLAVYKFENIESQVASDGPTGLMRADIVVACMGTTKAVAGQVAAAVQSALDGASGTWSGIRVQGCFLKEDGIGDNVVTEQTTEEILVYVRECNFLIWFSN